MRRYSVVLIPDPEAGGYTVLVPALPGCVTEGDTLDEAMANTREAIALHVDSLAADGEPVPVELEPPALAAVEV
jgi:antitoxin HicB